MDSFRFLLVFHNSVAFSRCDKHAKDMRGAHRPEVVAAQQMAAQPTAMRSPGCASTSRAFTIIELLVCLAVVGILCALLFPALRATREASQRLRCQTNMHAIGVAMSAYSNIHNDRLPSSRFAEQPNRQPQELMIAIVAAQPSLVPSARWDGLGWLIGGGFLHDGCECLYCPSHHGAHPFEREGQQITEPGLEPVYTNYHYSGHMDRSGRRISLLDGPDRMLLTDGLRTRSDFNHVVGANRLFADLHIDWWMDSGNALENALPLDVLSNGEQAIRYEGFWGTISQAVE